MPHTTGASPAVSCQQIHLQPIFWKADWNLPFYTWGTEDLWTGRGSDVYSNWGTATNGVHGIIIKTHPACDDRAEQLAALRTRGGGETWVCIAGTQSWGRGRNGNAESVKPHESPGEGGNGYTAVGKGKREVTARVRCAARCSIAPFITYLWMLKWQLSSLRQLVISLVLEGGAPPQSFQFAPQWLSAWQRWGKVSKQFNFGVLWTRDAGYLPVSETEASCFGLDLKGCDWAQSVRSVTYRKNLHA